MNQSKKFAKKSIAADLLVLVIIYESVVQNPVSAGSGVVASEIPVARA